jgi:hypothetical protein
MRTRNLVIFPCKVEKQTDYRISEGELVSGSYARQHSFTTYSSTYVIYFGSKEATAIIR